MTKTSFPPFKNPFPEFMLHIAFGLEDANRLPEAQKMVDGALGIMKLIPEDHPEMPYWLMPLLKQAKAHMFRNNANNVKKDDADALIHLIKTRGVNKPEEVEKELVLYWSSLDPTFKEIFDSKGKAEVDRPGNDINTGEIQIKLASALSAACFAQNFKGV